MLCYAMPRLVVALRRRPEGDRVATTAAVAESIILNGRHEHEISSLMGNINVQLND